MITGNESMHPVVIPGFAYADGSYENSSVKNGLTIRQHFAAMAMQGIVSNSEMQYVNAEDMSKDAVRYANALITELNKQT